MSGQQAGSADPQRLAEEIEELEYQNDVLAMRLAQYETANEEFIPGWVVDRLHAGEVPARVWRDYRGLSVQDVASAAGLDESVVAAIEAGTHEPGLRAMARVAQALRVEVDELVPWSQKD